MGRIYAESELVIVAAAGSTSHYGLPGVSTRPRKAQRMIELDTEVQLIEMFDNDSTLRESVWAKRGWTHQEGYLAARRLVFTDNEVSYSCERGVCQESVKRPGIDDHDFYMENYYPGFPLETKSQNRVADVLNSYSARKLSFEGDILSACTGTLEKLVDLHFWGIVARISASTSDIELSLEWSNYPYPGQKRTNFPSWSWVATTGTKRIKVDTHRNDRSFVAEVLATDGRWLTSGNHIESRYDSLPEGSGPTLRLTGSFYTASLMSGKLQKHGEESEKRPLVVFQYTDATGDGNELVLELWLDTELTDPILPVTVKAAAADGRGATIFTDKNFNGRSTAIPANDFCTDIDNIFGNFDGKIRSVTVEKGYHCKFYTGHDCPANGQKMECGSKDQASVFGDLGTFDYKIHSAYCTKI
ncbi:uncharacterized protein J4E92_006398 [Alternaria infectoria]|uniref:uncharacterized protein n=1 Tax=Alternaria infectoria TaxID=45303 RepID=UPI00221FB41B|nr:uncharacterized protein J4E92_006398 [Alternaria infectoria]KAI4927231.1 hypothetical protein J4E92_006398 [Alternaria infectoria]